MLTGAPDESGAVAKNNRKMAKRNIPETFRIKRMFVVNILVPRLLLGCEGERFATLNVAIRAAVRTPQGLRGCLARKKIRRTP